MTTRLIVRGSYNRSTSTRSMALRWLLRRLYSRYSTRLVFKTPRYRPGNILPKQKDLRRVTPPEAWECPPVTNVAERRQKRTIELSVLG